MSVHIQTFFYSPESRTMLNKHLIRITATEKKYFRKCMKNRKRVRINYAQIRRELGEKSLTNMVEKKGSRWFRHIMSEDRNLSSL